MHYKDAMERDAKDFADHDEPAELASGTDSMVSSIGLMIRQERQKRKLTLTQVSKKARLSPAFLSLVERGLATPSLGSLAGIAAALNVPVSTFVHVSSTAGAITRAHQRAQFGVEESGLRYERLSTVFPGQQMDAVIIHVPPGYSAETIAHAGEEWLYVLAGELEQTIDGETVTLGPGDTCHFRGDTPHSYGNRGAVPTAVIWVGTVPVFRSNENTQGFHP
ncbi:XRE family transcriptional regulator [Ferrovibrio sp.]|uniref:helix-turn-helix domain-containing protein n=1 Tax=Ferrovibrio sp. TaxID=1917215 RepID=UPI0025C6D4B8|nr:XRE family transcriptional regulator [Ferrovibrio sp.]MBX3454666.1 helix-turn-helix transcriptional regulator [Ferrovibrio sp.]